MARALRVEYPGAVHHVTSRGNERRNIFRSDADRRMFLEFLAAATKRFGWLVTAWVLMSNPKSSLLTLCSFAPLLPSKGGCA